MPDKSWSDKRARQYEAIKQSELDRGETLPHAKELAARIVNKNRAQAGESETASRTSVEDLSPQRRGGLRSHKGRNGPTRDQLYNEAKRRNVKGRSTMTKQELADALGY